MLVTPPSNPMCIGPLAFMLLKLIVSLIFGLIQILLILIYSQTRYIINTFPLNTKLRLAMHLSLFQKQGFPNQNWWLKIPNSVQACYADALIDVDSRIIR